MQLKACCTQPNRPHATFNPAQWRLPESDFGHHIFREAMCTTGVGLAAAWQHHGNRLATASGNLPRWRLRPLFGADSAIGAAPLPSPPSLGASLRGWRSGPVLVGKWETVRFWERWRFVQWRLNRARKSQSTEPATEAQRGGKSDRENGATLCDTDGPTRTALGTRLGRSWGKGAADERTGECLEVNYTALMRQAD